MIDNSENDGGSLARAMRVGIAILVVLIIVALFPVSPRPAIDIKIVLYQLGAALLGSVWLLTVVAGRTPLTWPRVFGPILVLMAIRHGASVIAADVPPAGILELSRTICLMGLFFVASQVYASARQARSLLIAICVGVALSSIYAFAQKAGVDPFPWEESQRETSTYLEMPGTFGNPNIAGHALILAILIAVYLTTIRSTRWCALFIPLFASHLYLTHFRAGLIALAAGAAVAMLAARCIRLRYKPVWTARVTIATALLAAATTGGLTIGYAYNASSDHRLLDDSLLLRYNAYYGAARMIAENPVHGVGPGMYEIENPPYWTEYEQRWLAEKHLLNEHVHSDVLEAWVETGMAGAALYVLLLLAGLYRSIRFAAESEGETRRLGFAMTAFFVAFATDGLFGFNARVPVTAALLFLMAGVIEGTYSPNRIMNPLEARPGLIARCAAIVLIGGLWVPAFIGTRQFTASVFAQSAENALAFRALADADRLSKRALELAPNSSAMHVTRAKVESQLGLPDRAVREYVAAASHRPHDVAILMGLAREHLSLAVQAAQRGDRDASEAALSSAKETAATALELCSYLPDAEEVLGRAALAKAQLNDAQPEGQHTQQAETHFLAALRNGANNVGVLLRLVAESRLLAGDGDGATEYFSKSVLQNPEAAATWKSFLRLAVETGRFGGLETALTGAIAGAENRDERQLTGRLLAWRAQAYLLAGRSSDDVVDEFDRALRIAPDDSETWKSFGTAARGSLFEDRFFRAVSEQETSLPHVTALRQTFDDAKTAAAALHGLAGHVVTPGYTDLQTDDVAWVLGYVEAALLGEVAENSDRVEGLAHIAAAYEVLGLIPEATEAYQHIALNASGSTQAAAVTKGAALLSAQFKFAEAITLIESALNQHSNNFALRLEYARALRGAAKPAAAKMELSALKSQFRLDSAQLAAVNAELDALSR